MNNLAINDTKMFILDVPRRNQDENLKIFKESKQYYKLWGNLLTEEENNNLKGRKISYRITSVVYVKKETKRLII